MAEREKQVNGKKSEKGGKLETAEDRRDRAEGIKEGWRCGETGRG